MGNYEISRDGDLWVLRSLCPPRNLLRYDSWSDAFIDMAILNDDSETIRSDDRSPRTSPTDHR
jgi:hypothetical protein